MKKNSRCMNRLRLLHCTYVTIYEMLRHLDNFSCVCEVVKVISNVKLENVRVGDSGHMEVVVKWR